VHTTLTDRNGNQILYNATLGQYTDTLGRTITHHCDQTFNNCEIDYTDSNGQVDPRKFEDGVYRPILLRINCQSVLAIK